MVMRNNAASKTAEMVTFARAVESIRPTNERVCNDPYAENFISPQFRFILKNSILRKLAVWYIHDLRGFYGFIGTVAFRVRFIDDCLSECINKGIKQLVILGAGYDTRAYRYPMTNNQIKVFEVDHPKTQKIKLSKVKSTFGDLPDYVTYCQINFEKDGLDSVLFNAGYNPKAKTLFIWEGVSYYVSAETVDKTLSFITNSAYKGSSIVFDYIFRSVIDGSSNLKIAKKIVNQHIQKGEPLIFGIQEGCAKEYLNKRGFSNVEDTSPQVLETKYLKDKTYKIKAYPFIGYIHAHI